MTQRLEVYKCNVCGNMVEIVHEAAGQLVCCNQPMTNVIAGTVDAAKEKHIPVVTKKDAAYTINIGSVAHPMEDKHYIEWVQIISGDKSYREFLKPGMEPKALFDLKSGKITAREYCNLHGLWSKEE
ncbi:MAG: desulfoferrodoxin [Pseudomonadota bacterium]